MRTGDWLIGRKRGERLHRGRQPERWSRAEWKVRGEQIRDESVGQQDGCSSARRGAALVEVDEGAADETQIQTELLLLVDLELEMMLD